MKNTINRSEKIFEFIFGTYSLIIGVLSVFFFFKNNFINLELIKFIIILNIILFLIFNLKADFKNKILHPNIIFFITLILFIYSRIILDVFGLADIKVPGYMSYEIISDFIIEKALLALLIFLCGYSFGVLVVSGKPISPNIINFDKSIFVIGRILFFIGLIPALYIQIITLEAVNSLGYLAIFRGEIEVEVPLFVRLLAGLFRVGFIFILISGHNKRTTLLYISIFMIFIILNLLIGIRGYYMSFVIVLIWYWFKIRKFGSISIYKLGIIFLSIIFFANLIALNRDLNISISSLILLAGFFYDQSTSFLTIVYGIEYGSQIGNISYLNLFDVLYQSGNLIQDKIDYQVNPSAKEQGNSFGGSIIQEHIIIGGGLGLFIFAILWAVAINESYRKLVRYRLGIGLLIIFLPNIFFSPRARTLDLIATNTIFFFILIIAYSILFLLKNQKSKIKNQNEE